MASSKTYRVFSNGPVYRERTKPEENVIDFSSFRQLHMPFASRSFSIKYVAAGTELYSISGRSYAVEKENYLLTNAFSQGGVIIDSNQDVKGVCIELSPGLLAEVLAIHHNPESPYPRKDFYDYLTTARFFEHKYKADSTSLGTYLNQLRPEIHNNFTSELYIQSFFYHVAEHIMADQLEMHGRLNSFSQVKDATKKDLLRRLLAGKTLMDDCYAEQLSIGEIAQTAAMSEYYFLRLFRQVFNCSPYRYIINKRLQKAAVLLSAGHVSAMDIACKCGFADIQSFSKAFKKRYGKAPTAFRNQCSIRTEQQH